MGASNTVAGPSSNTNTATASATPFRPAPPIPSSTPMRPIGPTPGQAPSQTPLQPSQGSTASASPLPVQRDSDSAEITVELDCGVFDCSDADINRFLDDLQQ